MEKNTREIPKKNYVVLGVVLLISLLLVYYFYMWFSAYKDTKTNMMILDNYLSVINYNELGDYLVENPNCVIYVSKLEDDKIRDFEKKFRNSLKSKDIDRDILYMNITDELKNKKLKKNMKQEYFLENSSLIDVPNISIFENGELKLIYNISDNGYDIKKLEKFLKDYRDVLND